MYSFDNPMRLFKLCPNAYDKSTPKTYKPEEGITLSYIHNVPCLTIDSYAWVRHTTEDEGSDINCHILPVVPKEETRAELLCRIKTHKRISNPILIKYASLHKNSNGVNFLKEEDYVGDENVIVSLALPLSAAQPHYEFEGDTEVLLGAYATYYGRKEGDNYIEKEDALCSAIVRMGENAKVSFVYTNRCSQGQIIENIVGHKFEFICSGGRLLRLDDYKFQGLFSGFLVS